MQRLHQNHEPDSVPSYVSTLEKQLSRSLPQDKAEQIAQETHAHLADRVDDLVETGLTESEAEAVALSGFGRVRTYARTAVQNAYADRTSQRWRLLGRLGMANFLAFNAVHVMYPTNQMASFIVAPALGGLALTLVSALASRRPQTRQIIAMNVIGLLATITIAGVRYVPNPDTPPLGLESIKYSTSSRHGAPGLPRGDYQQEIAHEKRRLRHLYYETNVVQQGMEVYAQGKPVPASLRSGGRYIVPLPYRTEWNTCSDALDMSAFKDYYWPDEWLASYESRLNAIPYQTVATSEEARKIWGEHGPLWRTGKQRRIAYWNAEFATMKHAETAPLGFNATAAAYHGYASVQLCLTLIVLDFILAYLGRWVWIQTRNRRRGQTASS